MYICLCKAISDQVLNKIIVENKAQTVKDVRKHCPVGGGCGMCLDQLKALLQEKQLDKRLEPSKLQPAGAKP